MPTVRIRDLLPWRPDGDQFAGEPGERFWAAWKAAKAALRAAGVQIHKDRDGLWEAVWRPVGDLEATVALEVELPAAEATIPVEQVIGLHESLRWIARRQGQPGQGFGLFDLKAGERLAGRQRLTQREAVTARRLARKYRRQLPASLLAAAGLQEEDKAG